MRFTLFSIVLLFGHGLATNKISCNEDYSPCQCSLEVDGSAIIVCSMVSVEDVERIFSTTTLIEINSLKWIFPEEPNVTTIPDNLLNNKRVRTINLNCSDPTNGLIIETNAFRSSQDVTYDLEIRGCDFSDQLDYSFINGFSNLSYFLLDSMTNIPSIAQFPPSLPKLDFLEVARSSGLEEIDELTTIPKLSYPSLKKLSLMTNRLTDRAVDQILNAVYPSVINSLELLKLDVNLLTKIPAQVPDLFPMLRDLSISTNRIQQIISPITFSQRVHSFYMTGNGLNYISPGTFKGNFTGAFVELWQNNLTLFEAEVFKPMLEDMALLGPYQSRLDIFSNPFDCDGCGLAWLIRDNRQLLFPVNTAQCSNLTTFEQLDPNGYRGCP